jgi:CrcB protein
MKMIVNVARACATTNRKGPMKSYLIVFLGAGLGGALRHLVNILAASVAGALLPWGTFIVNVTGSLAMGLLIGYFAFRGDASQDWRLFLTTGLLGGYTTFSSFSLDAALLWERGAIAMAVLYVIGSVVLAICGLALGIWLMRARASL